VELNSEQAAAMKESYEQQQEMSRHEEPKPLDPSPADRLFTLLKESESGKSNAFIEITWVLSVEPDSNRYGDDYAADIESFPVGRMRKTALAGESLRPAAASLEMAIRHGTGLGQTESHTRRWQVTERYMCC
jgi:hypothetical protein